MAKSKQKEVTTSFTYLDQKVELKNERYYFMNKSYPSFQKVRKAIIEWNLLPLTGIKL